MAPVLARLCALDYTPAMPEQPDLESLAKRYLDLWQEQVTAMAADPALADAMTRLFGLAAMDGAGAPAGDEQGRHAAGPQSGNRKTTGSDAPGAAASAAASSSGALNLGELAARIADVEKRLAALEAGAGGKRGAARKKPRKRST